MCLHDIQLLDKQNITITEILVIFSIKSMGKLCVLHGLKERKQKICTVTVTKEIYIVEDNA